LQSQGRRERERERERESERAREREKLAVRDMARKRAHTPVAEQEAVVVE
jgi:hypothetical protein